MKIVPLQALIPLSILIIFMTLEQTISLVLSTIRFLYIMLTWRINCSVNNGVRSV